MCPYRVDAIAVVVNLACAEENKIMLVYHPGLLDAVINISNHDPIDEAREHAAIVLMNLVRIGWCFLIRRAHLHLFQLFKFCQHSFNTISYQRHMLKKTRYDLAVTLFNSSQFYKANNALFFSSLLSSQRFIWLIKIISSIPSFTCFRMFRPLRDGTPLLLSLLWPALTLTQLSWQGTATVAF